MYTRSFRSPLRLANRVRQTARGITIGPSWTTRRTSERTALGSRKWCNANTQIAPAAQPSGQGQACRCSGNPADAGHVLSLAPHDRRWLDGYDRVREPGQGGTVVPGPRADVHYRTVPRRAEKTRQFPNDPRVGCSVYRISSPDGVVSWPVRGSNPRGLLETSPPPIAYRR